MKRMLFNATQAEELRVAIVDGQNLLDLDIETLGKEQRKGNIYKGIITRIEPSLEACFVDYGTDRHGFLPFKEVSRAYFQDYEGGRARIQDVLKEGMQVIVQVEKDERGNKGAALTTFISLAGRYLVLMPNNPRGGGVSRRIEGEDRAELKEAMAELEVPHGMSLIARTAGIGRSVEELQWDFNYLLQLWRAIEEAGAAHQDPYLLFMESSLLIRAIRDYFRPDIGEILIDNAEVFAEISEFVSYVMPNNVSRLKLYQDHIPLFSRFQIEHQIESAFARSVSLPSGGAIVIDHTEALVSIDVNSARATRGADIEETAFKTNMEAAEEVARQMRLRDLGGLVVIDFIDMENPKHQRDVETTLRDALKKDRARVQMGKLSRFGLLELSRQRLKPALEESSHVACPRCAGTGVIRGIESTALHVLRIIQEEAMKDNTGEVHAQVPVDVATFLLNEKRAELFAMEERLDVNVMLIPNIHMENPHYEISRIRTDDIEEDGEPSYKRMSEPEKNESDKPLSEKTSKATRPEPAVKGVKHSQPAPIIEKKSASWWDNFKAWFKGLFSEKEEERKPANKKRTQNTTRRNSPNRRQKTRRKDVENKAENEIIDNKNDSAPRSNKRVKDKENTNNRQRQLLVENIDNIDDNVVVSQPLDKEKRSNHRKNNREIAPEVLETPIMETVETAETMPASVEVNENERDEPKGKNQRQRKNHREQNDFRQQNRNNRNNRNEKKRNIPSANKIEQYLMIDDIANRVRSAVAHVYGEKDDLATNDEPLLISVPVDVNTSNEPVVQQEPLVVVISHHHDNEENADAAKFIVRAIEHEDNEENVSDGIIAQEPSEAVEVAQETVSDGIVAQEPSEALEVAQETVSDGITAQEPSEAVEVAPETVSDGIIEQEPSEAVETAQENVSDGITAQEPSEAVETAQENVENTTFEQRETASGLIQVQTSAQALAQAQQFVQPLETVLRRADMPKHEEVEMNAEPLIQVETTKL